ncbi:unnamed protein product [Mytilus coruscus]|uniref:Uncharacterized protein n=1 Tax=Mytilus coruscus TaxID=42192 RepID=A0A6J8C469_MYTCO|nr:unnamed protein product [Mytilus coruscus]
MLFTDSKGFSVDKVVPDSVRDKFHIVAKSRTTATTDEHLINLFAKLEELKLKDPIILIWFGTCEITTKGKEGKKNKDILDQNNNRTKPTNYSLVGMVGKKYSGTRIVTKKERNKRHYMALVIDKTKGFRSVTQASSLDKELCYQVDYYNRQLK